MKEIKILLIDDEEDYSETMGFYLKAKGYRVRTACSGQAGIDEINKEAPDMVFLDFMMPEMDGVDTLKMIRGIDKALPVIMVTSYATEKKIEEANALGISGVFPKGDDFAAAAGLINEVLKCLNH